MPTFHYKAKSGPHDFVEGKIEAENERDAHQKLTRQGLFPILVTAEGAKPAAPFPAARKRPKKARGRVGVSELALFTFHLSNLVSSGLALARALELLGEQIEHGKLSSVCVKLRDDIKEGTHFSDALDKFPEVFPPLFVNTVRAGEAGGTLEEVLKNLSETYEREDETRSKVKQAFIYPVVVLIVAVIAVGVLLIFVVPNLTQMYEDLDQTLPLLTRVVVGISAFVTDYWWIILLAVCVVIFGSRASIKQDRGKKIIYNIFMKIPIFGDIMMRSDMASFSRVLGMLLTSGVSILEALRVTESTMEVPAFIEEVVRARGEVTRGEPLSKALSEHHIFPKFVTQMIAIGEESGDLDQTLMRVARTYDREVSRKIILVTTILEPILIVVIGAIVGVIIIAMLLPIFEINLMVS